MVETNHQASMEPKIKMTIEAAVNLVVIEITLIQNMEMTGHQAKTIEVEATMIDRQTVTTTNVTGPLN